MTYPNSTYTLNPYGPSIRRTRRNFRKTKNATAKALEAIRKEEKSKRHVVYDALMIRWLAHVRNRKYKGDELKERYDNHCRLARYVS